MCLRQGYPLLHTRNWGGDHARRRLAAWRDIGPPTYKIREGLRDGRPFFGMMRQRPLRAKLGMQFSNIAHLSCGDGFPAKPDMGPINSFKTASPRTQRGKNSLAMARSPYSRTMARRMGVTSGARRVSTNEFRPMSSEWKSIAIPD